MARQADGTMTLGRALPGRGAWICAGSVGCLDQAARRGAFARAFRAPVRPEAVATLREAWLPMCEDRGPGTPQERRLREGY